MSLRATASQTAGPYFAIGFRWGYRDALAGAGAAGARVTIEGRVLDGDGEPVADACLEIWQADAHGRYAHPEDTRDPPHDRAFRGHGRVPTDARGAFRLSTIKPGAVPGPGGRAQAPHLVVAVFARGLLRHLVTRMYFPDEPGHAADPILERVPAERRSTLVARRRADGVLEWNVLLQGEGETVFFDC